VTEHAAPLDGPEPLMVPGLASDPVGETFGSCLQRPYKTNQTQYGQEDPKLGERGLLVNFVDHGCP